MFDIFFGAKGTKTPFPIFPVKPVKCQCGKYISAIPAGSRIANGLIYVYCDACETTNLVNQPITATPKTPKSAVAC